jgi:prophage antirepressor-like protein
MIQTFAGCIEGTTVAVAAMVVDGVPWFRGNDVAAALGYKQPRNAVAKYVDDGHKRTKGTLLGSTNLVLPPRGAFLGGGDLPPPPEGSDSESEALAHNSNIEMWIDEPGVYALVFRSKRPEAKAFQDWVYSEVLPSIRKTGSYKRRQELETDRLAIENNIARQRGEIEIANLARQALLDAYGKLDDAQEWAYHDRVNNVLRGQAQQQQDLTHAGLFLVDRLGAAQARKCRSKFGKICARRLREKLGTDELPKAVKNVEGNPCSVVVFRVPQDLDVLEAGLRELQGDESSSESGAVGLGRYFRSRPY